jgi:hypothetical protein
MNATGVGTLRESSPTAKPDMLRSEGVSLSVLTRLVCSFQDRQRFPVAVLPTDIFQVFLRHPDFAKAAR